MSALQFCADVLKRGLVCGVGIDSRPADWDEALGVDYLQDVRKGRMRRDYGLVELSFLRLSGEWLCTEISIQVHRLNSTPDPVIPDAIENLYGEFESRVCLSSLSGLMAREGVHLASIEDQSRDWCSRFTVEESSAIVHVVSGLNGPVGDLNAGDVWSISVSRDYARWRLPIS